MAEILFKNIFPSLDVHSIKERLYAPDRLDNDVFFRRMIYDTVDSSMRVLDAGAGAGDLFSYDLKSRVREIVGVDLDRRVEANPQIHLGITANLETIPLEDETFDIVFSRYVLEHVSDPTRFLGEMHRILKLGGRFLFLTPNKKHYVALGARFTPQKFHLWFNRKRGREEADTFPTLYKLNSRRDIRRCFKEAGFRENRLIGRECSPNYLTFNLLFYLFGVAYERTVTSLPFLSGLRVNLIGDFIKT